MYPNEVEKSNDNNKNKSNDNNNKNGNDNNNDSNKIKEVDTEKKEPEKPKKKIQKKKNRCWKCNKKVTLAGQFKCKCGYVYCARCRYPDAHNCEFDWKKQHQDKLAKDNKIVAFSKLDKI